MVQLGVHVCRGRSRFIRGSCMTARHESSSFSMGLDMSLVWARIRFRRMASGQPSLLASQEPDI